VGFETTIAAFERKRTVHTLDRAATVVGSYKDIIDLFNLHAFNQNMAIYELLGSSCCPRRGFGWVRRFIGCSPGGTTVSCNTFILTVTITLRNYEQ
jgi:hypothetical protein